MKTCIIETLSYPFPSVLRICVSDLDLSHYVGADPDPVICAKKLGF
jgi:hypothetical protein